jgi:outer membrane biosynthesis protein TonB
MRGPSASPETSYKLVMPRGAPRYALKPGQSASLPTPLIGYFAPPIYPPSLARPGMPPVVVTAHLVFGTDGKVQAVAIVSDSYPATGHVLFEAAVREATRGWKFTPLVFTETAGGGGTPVTLKHESRPFSLWFEFHFAMVDGKPAVETVKR